MSKKKTNDGAPSDEEIAAGIEEAVQSGHIGVVIDAKTGEKKYYLTGAGKEYAEAAEARCRELERSTSTNARRMALTAITALEKERDDLRAALEAIAKAYDYEGGDLKEDERLNADALEKMRAALNPGGEG